MAVYNPYKIDSNKDKGEKHLDPFHSHFILIDDGEMPGNQRGTILEVLNKYSFKPNHYKLLQK